MGALEVAAAAIETAAGDMRRDSGLTETEFNRLIPQPPLVMREDEEGSKKWQAEFRSEINSIFDDVLAQRAAE